MTIDRNTVLVIVAAAALGYWMAGESHPAPPRPTDRPVLTWIARAAKSLLWIAVFAEKPPAEAADARMVHHAVGADGYPIVDHARGL